MRISVLGDGSSGSQRDKSDPMPEPRAPRKRKFENDEKKTISRNVKNKRTADEPKPPKPVFKGNKGATDGSGPLKKKKKSYTKKPKRS